MIRGPFRGPFTVIWSLEAPDPELPQNLPPILGISEVKKKKLKLVRVIYGWSYKNKVVYELLQNLQECKNARICENDFDKP